jgi:hypothetical protein
MARDYHAILVQSAPSERFEFVGRKGMVDCRQCVKEILNIINLVN